MYTKEQIAEKIKGIDEEILASQLKIVDFQGTIRDAISKSPEIQTANQEINTLVAGLNKLNGKKEAFQEMLSEFEPSEEIADE